MLDSFEPMDYIGTAIFGKKALRQLSSSDYVDWAGDMLVQNKTLYISPNCGSFASNTLVALNRPGVLVASSVSASN
jgi:hypothetical protein